MFLALYKKIYKRHICSPARYRRGFSLLAVLIVVFISGAAAVRLLDDYRILTKSRQAQIKAIEITAIIENMNGFLLRTRINRHVDVKDLYGGESFLGRSTVNYVRAINPNNKDSTGNENLPAIHAALLASTSRQPECYGVKLNQQVADGKYVPSGWSTVWGYDYNVEDLSWNGDPSMPKYALDYTHSTTTGAGPAPDISSTASRYAISIGDGLWMRFALYADRRFESPLALAEVLYERGTAAETNIENIKRHVIENGVNAIVAGLSAQTLMDNCYSGTGLASSALPAFSSASGIVRAFSVYGHSYDDIDTDFILRNTYSVPGGNTIDRLITTSGSDIGCNGNNCPAISGASLSLSGSSAAMVLNGTANDAANVQNTLSIARPSSGNALTVSGTFTANFLTMNLSGDTLTLGFNCAANTNCVVGDAQISGALTGNVVSGVANTGYLTATGTSSTISTSSSISGLSGGAGAVLNKRPSATTNQILLERPAAGTACTRTAANGNCRLTLSGALDVSLPLSGTAVIGTVDGAVSAGNVAGSSSGAGSLRVVTGGGCTGC